MNRENKPAKQKESPTCGSVWKEYEKGLVYKTRTGLFETVKTNENFFIGKQWEGVESDGLPTPVFNFLKRVVLFTVAGITSSCLKMRASAMRRLTPDDDDVADAEDIVNSEFDRLFEINRMGALIREFLRNAAVDGDGCTYTYWNPDAETGQASRGAIVTEIIENTRVFFGNPRDRRVSKQPYIIISSREMTGEVRRRAREAGAADWETITSDTDEGNMTPEDDGDLTTVLLKLWKNPETGTVWAYECARTSAVREAWDTGLTLYPVTWLNWDYIQDSYHGMAMITGLIPNQIFINKLYAMSMISLMTTAYPKIVYDKTRVQRWDNRVGAAIPVQGGDVSGVAKIIDPAQISPQIAQFIQMAVSDTQANLGATSVALGDARPENTSAIIAL